MKDLAGTWQLVKTSAVASDGSSLKPPYGGDAAMGVVTFREDGRMICVLCDSRSELPADQSREYNSYCGAWSYDGKQLVTRVDASSNEKWIDTDQVRDVAFQGDTLILKPPMRAYDAQPEQRTLHWKKIG